jgi:hypothetical protein
MSASIGVESACSLYPYDLVSPLPVLYYMCPISYGHNW